MKKILIIEDESTLLATLGYLLLYAGYQVVSAIDGVDGLEKVQQEKPDLILCDVMMPKLNGYNFLKQHCLSSYSHIPVVLMSAKSDLEDELQGLALGAKAYIRKPFRFEHLETIIKKYLLTT
ncbi:response regulator transcription factor [Flavobacterium sp. ACAM 123]|uniref:response regulator transcription factor n=1 Tax=Flavobacterium sp. ACAM 123 TaxID=1189620 RepID=UPI000308AEA8|nr:response regulator [Flavobacterium sp. ACAM 123]